MKPLVRAGRAIEIVRAPTLPDDAVLRLRQYHRSEATPDDRDAILIRTQADIPSLGAAQFSAAVAVGDIAVPDGLFATTLRLSSDFDYLADGDIIGVHARNQRVRTLYRRSSRHNFFLVTERCNHYCLMCSQPPKDVDDSWILGQIEAALPLIDPDTRSIGFTGGEPLLQWERFIRLLGQARDQLPQTAIHVLTNGRAFAAPEIARAWAGVGHPNLMAGIPIYSAIDHVHDYVVQAPGAFDETVLGILRLKDQGQRIEIRVVLHQITAPRIVETARWLARNLPFVNHVALMGLENTGFAIANHDLLWIDPIDYKDELALAVDILDAARVNVSIYNLPYCVLDRSVWPFARQSISDWKNAYLPQCDDCQAKSRCAGFFSSGKPRNSRAIQPLHAFDLD
jgi:His-Xaa-Ser system radical SAM maturase HxsC